jgi:hypothetical protein
MRGQLGYQDYIGDLEDLCRVWNGGFVDPKANYTLFEWDATDDNRLYFGMSTAEAEDSDWSGPPGYR